MVVDLMMPGLDGLEVTRRVGLVSPCTRVLILSGYADDGYVRRALRNGASGYLVKGASCAQLVEAVRCAVAGICYLSPDTGETEPEPRQSRPRRTRRGPCNQLTPREREVLLLAAEGLTSRVIGERLAISTRTAEAHRANLKRKLGLRSQTELIRFAIKNGIVSLED
jgi:DNA-binding NarL/FixJ family response regulator